LSQRGTDCVNERTGMAEGVLALQAAKVVGRSTFWKAIGVAGGDVKGIEHPEAILQI